MTPCLRQTPGGSLWSSSPAGRLPANAVGKIFINRKRDDNDDDDEEEEDEEEALRLLPGLTVGHVAARFGSSVSGGELVQTEGPGVGLGGGGGRHLWDRQASKAARRRGRT